MWRHGDVLIAAVDALPQEAKRLILEGRAPAGLRVRGLLDLSQTNVRELPAALCAETLDVSACASLAELPEELSVRRLRASACRALRTLPRGLTCYEMD